jgi:FAD/FMN-containing dehydrogenase/Fe-S oxidoreductase
MAGTSVDENTTRAPLQSIANPPSRVSAIAEDGARSHALARRLLAEHCGDVLFDRAARGRYATDASIYQIMPVGVLVPHSARDVEVALALAREAEIPVLARGAGTSQCGQTTGAALVIDHSRHLRSIISVDAQARTATVEPGVVLDELNARLKPLGLWFPVDVSTSAQATLGGMAGNNSCGSRSIAYGNMVHNVVAITAWLSDGAQLEFASVASATGRTRAIGEFVRTLAERERFEIEARWPRVMRRVGGYNLDIFHNQSERPYTDDGSVNLAHLLVGSEGTLAFTKSLTLKLADLPRARVLGVVNFASFRAAMEAAQHIVTLGPCAVELVDRTMIDLALTNPAFRPVIRQALVGQPAAILLVEFAGDDRNSQLARLKDLVRLIADLGHGHSVVELVDEAIQRKLWEVRKAGLNIMMSLKGDGKPVSFIEDCAVPLEHLADYTDALTEVFERHGTRGTWYAHASVGTLHVRPILDMRQGGASGGAAKMRSIANEAAQLVRRFKGAYSGEHGDGLCRGEWIEWQFGAALNSAFKAIKHELDPIGLFNPGRIVDTPRMDDTSLFRFAPPEADRPYRTINLQPVLDWSAWDVQNDARTEAISAPGSGGDTTHGLAKAVEMCNNNGHCRKFDAGTMCPSYRVTRDEQHLTRGRANTLRLALSGQLGADALTGPELHESMSLCVGCKGCRRECPTGVDMSRMKTEFLAHYSARHGHSLKDRLVAHLPDYAERASRAAWLLNLRDQLPGAAWLSEKLLGFSARRRLPRWRRATFWRAASAAALVDRDEALRRAHAGQKVVVLWVDTFNGTFESENVSAALRVLTAAGYAIHVPGERSGDVCCGRTYLACGMVAAARTKLARSVAVLDPLASAGVAIVGLEPSCLLTLRDEALALHLGEAAERVASQALLFEEFVAREAAAGRFALKLRRHSTALLVHGHCHQKAFGAMPAIVETLRLIPEAQVSVVETSCCGMAGSFGYDAGHYDVSMQMAELQLLPALRARPEATVIAAGTSCRQQIEAGIARQALHVARLLDSLIDD